ncbi:MAG TPA: SRPBCC family protein [Flavisolibacter sp.]
MAKIYRLERVQKIPSDIETVWKFFSNANNLLSITPPFLNLKMTNEASDQEIHKGQTMTYIVKPLLGIPLSWLTEITEVDRLKMFIDEQKKGPYQLWRHQHHFKTIEGGVEMTDIVDYSLPFGFLGTLAHPIIVEKKLNQIFSYRHQAVEDLFGKWKGE